jgi:excisionase family DNA binding protein
MGDLPDKPTYTVTEFAFGFSVSKRTVYLWIQTGKVKTVRTPGGSLRIPREYVMSECQLSHTSSVL